MAYVDLICRLFAQYNDCNPGKKREAVEKTIYVNTHPFHTVEFGFCVNGGGGGGGLNSDDAVTNTGALTIQSRRRLSFSTVSRERQGKNMSNFFFSSFRQIM